MPSKAEVEIGNRRNGGVHQRDAQRCCDQVPRRVAENQRPHRGLMGRHAPARDLRRLLRQKHASRHRSKRPRPAGRRRCHRAWRRGRAPPSPLPAATPSSVTASKLAATSPAFPSSPSLAASPPEPSESPLARRSRCRVCAGAAPADLGWILQHHKHRHCQHTLIFDEGALASPRRCFRGEPQVAPENSASSNEPSSANDQESGPKSYLDMPASAICHRNSSLATRLRLERHCSNWADPINSEQETRPALKRWPTARWPVCLGGQPGPHE